MQKLVAAGAALGLLVVGLAGCSDSGKSAASESPLTPELAVGQWELVSGSGPEGDVQPLDGDPITLSIEADGAFSGTSGCNNIMGTMAITDGAVSMGPIGQTLMACEDDAMKVELAYTQALDSVSAGSASEDELVLRGDKTELSYKRS